MEKAFEFNSQTKEEWLEEIEKKAIVYTPEWRFNRELPDVGATLAILYADMMSDVIRHFNQVEQKNRMAFFERLGTDQKPAIPASGYITFQLMNQEVEGTSVFAGTRLIGDAKDGGSTLFETMEDVYVSPAAIQEIYLSDPFEDKISLLYQKTETEPFPSGFFLFDRRQKNLQRHRISFCHSFVLQIYGAAWISIDLQESRQSSQQIENDPVDSNKTAIKEAFFKQCRFFYYSETGYQEFEKQKIEEGQLMLYKGKEQPPFAKLELSQEAISGYFIQGEILDGRICSSFAVDTIALRTKGETLPELIYTGGTEQFAREFLPFGETPIPYMECYIASEEVFGKRGAQIEMEFDLDFIRVPLEREQIDAPEPSWKMIMKRSAIKAEPEYDISVEEVVWEYYNGKGFKRLFSNRQYEDLFAAEEGRLRRQVMVRFFCPMDIEPFFVSSVTACCIRIRILKMRHFYKRKGNYIVPRICFLKLRYEYQGRDIVPDGLILENNLERVYYSKEQLCKRQSPIFLTPCRDELQTTMYLGFDLPLKKGPLRMLCSMKETIQKNLPPIYFEYYGSRGWRTLHVVDETEQFKKTGLLTIIEPEQFTPVRLFGKERYWIRLFDSEKWYQKLSQREERQIQIPYFEHIYFNSTFIKGVETMEEEFFSILPNQKNLICQLNYGQIEQLEVWVNEKKYLHPKELEELKKQKRIEETFDYNGLLQEVWVLWKEGELFDIEGIQQRTYQLDRKKGVLFFSNKSSNRALTDAEGTTVRIRYRITDAERGNLSEGNIHTLESDIGFISEVCNYEATTGGMAQETTAYAVERSAAALRHGNRAVTARDFEDLAKEASRNISKAKCFSNYNAEGKKQYGAVTLVLLQKDFEEGRKYFDHVRKQVMDYLKPRMNEELYRRGLFQIVEVEFIKLDIAVSVVVWESHQIFWVRQEIEKRLKAFLHPITGNRNHTGFEIGVLPNEMQILNLLQEIPSIKTVRSIRLSATRFDQEKAVALDLERLNPVHYMLAQNGSHQIQIQANQERREQSDVGEGRIR